MVSAILTWKGATEPFFVDGEGVKINGEVFLQHLEQDLIPGMKEMYPRNDFIYLQDSAPSHRCIKVLQFLKRQLNSRYVKNIEWPPNSPDCNPLDYYFWDKVKVKVYKGRHCDPFKTLDELSDKTIEVWDECASDTTAIRKAIRQFLPRLQAVVVKDVGPIKTIFG